MKKIIQFALIGLVLALSGCTSSPINSPDGVVEAYYQALVKKDAAKAASLSCIDWEADAQTEAESFTAVTTSLENIDCQPSGVSGDYTIISCKGKIVANYGNEILEINLENQTYRVIQENGTWRMCGYQ